MSAPTRDQFETYKKVLALAQANPTKKGLRDAIVAAGISFNEDNPISGYFRKQDETGAFSPVGIWRDVEGTLLCYWGANEARVEKVWPYCAWYPVPYKWFKDKLDGIEWPDVHVIKDWRDDEDAPPPIGHNAPPLEEHEQMQREVANVAKGVADYSKIEDDDTAKRAQTLRSDLLAIANAADKRREELKRPHLDAGRAVDAKWNPIVKAAQAAADAIRAAMSAWETAKLRKREEENAKREEERRRIEAEARARNVAPPPPEPEPERVAQPTAIRGGTGRAAHIKEKEIVVEITDIDLLFRFFRENNAVRELLLMQAQRVLDSTGEVAPGVKTETKRLVA